jgi:hypothetical protein
MVLLEVFSTTRIINGLRAGDHLVHDPMHRARMRAEFAPPGAGTIVRADTNELCELRLKPAPLDGEVTQSRFHRGCRGIMLLPQNLQHRFDRHLRGPVRRDLDRLRT